MQPAGPATGAAGCGGAQLRICGQQVNDRRLRAHLALLLPLPAAISDHARLMRLSCTMHSVTVSFVLLAGEGWPDGLPYHLARPGGRDRPRTWGLQHRRVP